MRVAISVLLGLVFVAALVFQLAREAAVECEVCIAFGAQTACRRSTAATREQALQMAQSTACAVLSDGVTDGIRCQNVSPRSATCSGGDAGP